MTARAAKRPGLNNKVDLDNLDLLILREIQVDGRVTIGDLSERVDLTSTSTARRLSYLEESGVIKGYAALIDKSTVGFPISAIIRVRLDEHFDSHLSSFENDISVYPEIMGCYLMAGETDYQFRVVARSFTDFEHFLRHKVTVLPNVANVSTTIALREIIDRPAVPLAINEVGVGVIEGRVTEPTTGLDKTRVGKTLDRIDLRIVHELQTNGRISNEKLSQLVCLSPSPCLRRVKILESMGVIKGYVGLINPLAIGLSVTSFVRVRLRSRDDTHLSKFEESIVRFPEVTGCYLMIGDYDYELRILVNSLEAFELFVRDQLTRIPGVRKVTSSFALRCVVARTALPISMLDASLA